MIVVKLGGAALQHSLQSDELFGNMLDSYNSPVIVHGGGPEISKMAETLQVKSEFFEGQRVTTPELLEVVEMVLKGKINPQIVRSLQKNKRQALGLSGTDLSLLECRAEKPELGLVGRVSHCRSEFLNHLLQDKIIPVIAPIAYLSGAPCNVNADWAASAIAQSLKATELLFLTDSPGILDENGSLIQKMNPSQCQQLIKGGVVMGGMLVKCQAALEFLESATTSRVRIAGGKTPEELNQVFIDPNFGTVLLNN